MKMKTNKKKLLLAAATAVAVLMVVRSGSSNGSPVQTNNAKETTMEHLTLESFKDKICECGLDGNGAAEWKFKGELPAVIDFYADWCGPCKMVAPIMEELAGEYEGKLNIYKVNTEDQQQLAAMFGIRSIPSILFIPPEGKPQMAAGALPKTEFVKMFRDILGVHPVTN